MPRKTLPVSLIIERGNHYLQHSDDDKQRERYAVASFMEALLHDAHAYQGFRFLDSAEVNYTAIERGEDFDARDDSRRHYNLHVGLR